LAAAVAMHCRAPVAAEVVVVVVAARAVSPADAAARAAPALEQAAATC
jgi:hypothetical protein